MVKTTGFTLDENSFRCLPGLHRLKERRKNVGLDWDRTEWTLNEIACVNPGFGQRQMAFGTCDRSGGHLRLSHADHTRIGDMIVQRAFLAVECRYDIADVANTSAQNFRPGSAKSTSIAD